MSDAGQREWRFYLDDMIKFAGKVLAYTDGLDQAGFMSNGLTYDATLRNLELIVERPKLISQARATKLMTSFTTVEPDSSTPNT
jgi:uncharacterized protein with HEPN domain